MKLFEDYPVLYDGHITIKQMTIDDAADLSEMTREKMFTGICRNFCTN